VVPGSPADDAGIVAGESEVTTDGPPIRVGGDLIVAVDSNPVATMSDVIAAVDARDPGDQLELTVLRDGERRELSVELDERPESARQ
jgi:S1-C subfamily serine protease